MSLPCKCTGPHVHTRMVLTGGPGGGKTAVLELVRQHFCEHVYVLHEAAGIVFGGGFPRASHDAGLRAAQRAIFYVQRELEAAAEAENPAIVLCDRATIDGAAYWPGPPICGLPSARTRSNNSRDTTRSSTSGRRRSTRVITTRIRCALNRPSRPRRSISGCSTPGPVTPPIHCRTSDRLSYQGQARVGHPPGRITGMLPQAPNP
jgi:hypothetical protein